jgi:hypothetical protein
MVQLDLIDIVLDEPEPSTQKTIATIQQDMKILAATRADIEAFWKDVSDDLIAHGLVE